MQNVTLNYHGEVDEVVDEVVSATLFDEARDKIFLEKFPIWTFLDCPGLKKGCEFYGTKFELEDGSIFWINEVILIPQAEPVESYEHSEYDELGM